MAEALKLVEVGKLAKEWHPKGVLYQYRSGWARSEEPGYRKYRVTGQENSPLTNGMVFSGWFMIYMSRKS